MARLSLTIATTLTACGTLLAQNLVRNGSFEEPVINRGGFRTFTGSLTDDNWFISRGSVDICNTPLAGFPAYPSAYDGAQNVDLDGNSSGTLYQDINIATPGIHTLSFALNGWHGDRLSKTMDVRFEDLSTSAAVFSNTYTHNPGDPWVVYAIDINISDAGTYRLSFADTSVPNGYGAVLDDVRLELVPEPASLAALSVGLAGLLRLRRRRA